MIGWTGLALAAATTLAACSPNHLGATPSTPNSTAPASTTTATTTSTTATSTTSVASTTTQAPTTVPTSTTAPSTTTSLFAGKAAVRVLHGTNGRPIVAVTFDAGSDTGNAARILDILAANHVRASFGVTGRWAELNPDLFRRMAANHQIINHTYDHKSWTGLSTHMAPLSDAERLNELQRAEAAYQRIAGITAAPYFRAPFGDVDKAVDPLLGAHGYHYDVWYTTDSRGWQGATPAAIVQNCRSGEVPGGIIVFHVGSLSHDVDALQQVIDDIRAAGLTPGPVTDLI